MSNLAMKDFIQDTTTTTGTGTLTLADATISNRRKPSAVFANGEKVFYSILGGTELESGYGTFSTSGPTLSRDTIIESTNSNNAVSFSAGTKTVIFGLPAAVSQAIVPPFWSGIGAMGFNSLLPIPGSQQIDFRGTTVGTSELDLYTVPTGFRAIFPAALSVYNGNASTATISNRVKHSGTYYRLATTSGNINTLTNSAFNLTGFMLEAGDVFAVIASHATVSVISRVVIFPDTVPLKPINTYSLASGDNTIYTCPSGKVAILATQAGGGANGTILLSNQTGGTVTYTVHCVKSGGSATGANRISSSSVSDNTTNLVSSLNAVLTAGDFLVVNSSSGSTTQSVYAQIWELPAP